MRGVRKKLAALYVFGAILCLAGQARAEGDMPVACSLKHYGDCCTVTIDSIHPVAVGTAIVTGAQVNYVLIANKGQNDCIFLYDGEMQVPMQSYAGSFNGTWLGGNFTLSYQNDAAGKGSCFLDIYDMSIGHALPKVCVNGRFEDAPEKNPETQPKDADSKTVPNP
jgi:hypothetical protein